MKKVLDFHRWRRFAATVVREYREAGCRDSAASLTYTTLFAVVPIMTVAFAILKLIPQPAGIVNRIEALVFDNFLPQSGARALEYLVEFSDQAANLTAVGVLFLFVTAIMMLVTIERVFNRIWQVHRPRRLLHSLLVYWALLTLGPLLLGSGLAVSSLFFSLDAVSATVGDVDMAINFLAVLPFVFGAVFFSLAYILVPNCTVPIREGIIGGVVAALLLEAARYGFAFLVSSFSSWQLVYGAFAVVPIFLLWIYISWSITLFGVVLVYSLTNQDDDTVSSASAFPALLKVLALFRVQQLQGLAVTGRDARHVARHAGIDNWHELREQLLSKRVLGRDDAGNLLLLRDLNALRLADVVRLLDWEALDIANKDGQETDDFCRYSTDFLREAVAGFDKKLDVSVAVFLDHWDADQQSVGRMAC